MMIHWMTSVTGASVSFYPAREKTKGGLRKIKGGMNVHSYSKKEAIVRTLFYLQSSLSLARLQV